MAGHRTTFPAVRLSRRRLLAGAAAAALLGSGLRRAAAADHALPAFMRLSEALTGRRRLDAAAGARYLAALGERLDAAALARLLAAPLPADLSAAADRIVADWYSGEARIDGSTVSVDYDGALLWDALDFTKPPGQCGGETGFWADPPA
ncbi:Membrane bound FAD containing D-sorbitol dehydrogenase [Tistlia consotensis]|uniref:Membrane bound FAD containing D-sorbitol dehydrogenase n=1 Tax=Tistlia consotensis USBA 355 TaxID=560819 RepID=A0A1Y6BER8_9PROT|nr:sugar dehydrogenase complex small subunit [Tistlia consotensis]SME97747.1 Membrane bound FAD containing D-sorbitol dehydrogenase [Tistlia consotensis USBA 355]SNR57123.1 Membrane bound FAD containing D-sorbitol dehydrogenase [Tistlia consotensis]